MSDDASPVAETVGTPGQSKIIRLADFLKNGVGVRSVAFTGLLTLSVLYTLYFAKAFLLPIFLAALLALLLVPTVRRLKEKLHLPPPVGAGVVMFLLLTFLVIAIYSAATPAADWLQTVQARLPEMEYRLKLLKKPIQKVTEATARMERLTEIKSTDANKTAVVEKGENTPLRYLMEQTPAFITNLFVMFILLYFLLASGNSFLRKLVGMTPSFRDKVRAVEIARDIENKISKYLQITFVINACLGVLIGTAAALTGLQNYILWGVLGFLLNFIPYIGAFLGILSVFLVGLLTFPTLPHAFVMPGIYLALNIVEGNFVTPMVMGKFMTLDPVAIFISLMFWGWIWGIPGALLAVPILAVIKILCDHIEPLQAIGAFLGRIEDRSETAAT